ncbi:MAG TPA: hypothetical protein DDY43_11655, partial [Synechococcales bacterium UBA10510]|nr:hypothetical protein [Synechococcales bacterium UBA10510]
MIPTLLALLVGANGGSARANDSVRADTTLSSNSVVTPSTSGEKTTYTITGGTARNSGRYLFHSFQAFSLLQNEIGYFNNAPQIQTIFGRVTGGNQSNIDGLIKANGTANLFLINPKGIVFGPNARIDLGGAFKASTAKALDFNGQLFSAVNPQDAPLLTSDIVPGLQYGSSLATLKNEAVLVVKDGQEILLAGGPLDTVTSSGTLTANRGSITLSSGTTKVSGGSIQADGGNITISGGDIKIGSATGRTMLRAGNAQTLSSNSGGIDETDPASNLTLLDSAIKLTAGEGKSIEVFSGTAAAPGTTILRAATVGSVNPADPNSVNLTTSGGGGSAGGSIVVGGAWTSPIDIETRSSKTTLSTGTFLDAKDIYIRSLGEIKDDSQKNGSTNTTAASLSLSRADLANTRPSGGNTYSFEATGEGPNSGFINLKFDSCVAPCGVSPDPFVVNLLSGEAAKMRFKARNDITFTNVSIKVEREQGNNAGSFNIESDAGNITLVNSKLEASGSVGSITLSAKYASKGKITLENSELNTSNNTSAIAGFISINSNAFSLKESKVSAETTAVGKGGIITV